eukprot:CAMPEP_0168721550 /NCGR_PEP_ID=MMETSP0724-20121128/2141_1 /TAXON_ID=265536 /ORGANISM="Amphiprora sp., Strain CCMP467" /LENGTH=464 /DNA_ID=CAMNT_0008768197 /DNA_START=33 /DNA_END=1427 /DNA_ORIENTATION=+
MSLIGAYTYKDILLLFVVGLAFSLHRWGKNDGASIPKEPQNLAQTLARATTAEATNTADNASLARQPLDIKDSSRKSLAVEPRAFGRWPAVNDTLPCFDPGSGWRTDKTPTNTGFLFTKAFKCGSSTGAGIHLRIARNLARRRSQMEQYYQVCRARFGHAKANKVFANRDKRRSFLWTLVRDPTSRLVSVFFHMKVSRRNVPPTLENFVSFLTEETGIDVPKYLNEDSDHEGGAFSSSNGHYSHYAVMASLQPYNLFLQNPVQIMNQIMKDYDFIGVTERMDEVAVVLSMILNLPMADVLYLSAKANGGFDAGGFQNICRYIIPSFKSPPMKKLFATPQFQRLIEWDYQLHQAANRSLDLTISKLGRAEFEDKLAKYKHAQSVAKEMCLEKTVFPCSFGGGNTPKQYYNTDCIWKDSGCAYKCLDEVATTLGLWEGLDPLNVTFQEFPRPREAERHALATRHQR